jgi:hypothetical protein
MTGTSWHEEAGKIARTLQIIVGAMTAGAALFLAIAWILGPQVKPPGPMLPVSLTLIAFVLAGAGFAARFFVLRNITSKARREIANGIYQPVGLMRPTSLPSPDTADNRRDPHRDAKYLLSVFLHKTIVSAALFEGWAFFATIAYLIEGDPVSFALAAFLVLGVGAHFPTHSRAIGWVQGQLDTLEQERATG